MVFDRLSLRRGGMAQDDLMLDQFCPAYDETVIRHVVVDAPVGVTYQAIETADLTETGTIATVLSAIRLLPETIRTLRGQDVAEAMPERITFGDIDAAEGWVKLTEEADREFVFGAVGRFWQPTIEWHDIDAEEFAGFDEPGWGKIGASISVRPYGRDRTLLTFEARTTTTDTEARTQFGRYWLLIRPFAGYTMGRALARIASDAETAYAMADGDNADAETQSAAMAISQ